MDVVRPDLGALQEDDEPAPVAPAPPAAEPEPAAAGAWYADCTEVETAGAAPIHPGDPGWQSTFDRDDDGVGCES